ncbi:ATP-binding protein [Streptomyces sp. NPDC015125]|uniref:ATP-binding protein n=1 Tax=Streptomyces sp. NPDC015125 TaxID=3364938 RepID=UPI0036F760E3
MTKEDGRKRSAFEDADGFKPLSEQLLPEIRELALALRHLLKISGKSQRQFAAAYHTSVSSVSRYLSGERIPEKHFLDGLLKSACRAHDREVPADLQGRIYQLHRDALLTDNPARYREQMASDRLEEAVLREEELELASRDLHRQLQGRMVQLKALESQLHEVTAAQRQEQPAPGSDVERHRMRREELEEECARLRGKVALLERSLKDAERARDAARLRCRALEAELATATQAAERADLERQAREERLRLAKAVDVAEHRLADLDRVHQEAERVRTEADLEAARQVEAARAEADELLKDAALKAMRVRPAVLRRSDALRQLREAALEMADRRLPELAQHLASEVPHGLRAESFTQIIGLQGSGDIGQTARALEAAHRACVELAVDQAHLRQNSAVIVRSLARRCQGLLYRQLSRITEMEAAEHDPQRRAELFELDHLATMMRRICENLLTLAGTEPGGTGTHPMPLVDVLRAAACEVASYDRIELIATPASSIAGSVVNDLVHLLAELFENALAFSPPQAPVTVTGHALPDGRVLIEIHDRGIGMTAEDLAGVNERLAAPPTTVGLDGRVGLAVACLLGARHAFRMQLRPSDYGGLTALVMLPVSSVDRSNTLDRHQDLAVTTDGLFGTEQLGQSKPHGSQYSSEPVLHLFTICDSGGLFIERQM